LEKVKGGSSLCPDRRLQLVGRVVVVVVVVVGATKRMEA
jgi:hypothetical protein